MTNLLSCALEAYLLTFPNARSGTIQSSTCDLLIASLTSEQFQCHDTHLLDHITNTNTLMQGNMHTRWTTNQCASIDDGQATTRKDRLQASTFHVFRSIIDKERDPQVTFQPQQVRNVVDVCDVSRVDENTAVKLTVRS